MAPTRLNYLSRFLSFRKWAASRAALRWLRVASHPVREKGNSRRRVSTYSQNVRSAQQVPFPFFLLPSSCQRVPPPFLWTRSSLFLSLSLSLSFFCFPSFPSLDLLRSLAICKPPSFTGIGDHTHMLCGRARRFRVCTRIMHICMAHNIHTYMHKWHDRGRGRRITCTGARRNGNPLELTATRYRAPAFISTKLSARLYHFTFPSLVNGANLRERGPKGPRQRNVSVGWNSRL